MSAPASRLLHLLSTLQTRREWPGPALAERLGVSPRTVRRDLDRLRAMGYRISAAMGPDGGYRLEPGTDLPPLMFDDEQAVAVAVALQTSMTPGTGVEEAALRALMTLRQVMPARLKHRLDRMPVTTIPVRAGQEPPVPVVPADLLELSTTIRDRQVLRFDHTPRGSDDATGRRRVEPHGLVAAGHRWYLLAWDLDREDWRIFRVDQMVPRPPHGPRFVPRAVPGGSVGSYVSARFKGSERDDRWPCEGTVILDLPVGDVAPFIGDGHVEDHGDGRCLVRAGSWSWLALAAAFSRFDTAVEVVEPPELKHAFGVLARRSAVAAETVVQEPEPVTR